MNKENHHAVLAEKFNLNEERVDWHDETLWLVRKKRDGAVQAVTEWERLRDSGSHIKDHTLSNLDEYLIQFEDNAIKNGIHVHWASTTNEHNQIILDIICKNNISKIVKSKSMLTEECNLNEFLGQNNIEVIDTDLGERIVQLRNEHPSHIVLPAIHLKKEEVSDIFHDKLHTEKGNNNPQYLAEAARKDLRERFVKAELAITGVNFAIAETGGIVICTNEGNADLGAHAAAIQISCMGVEKIIPKSEHLGVFLRLLARSATGQSITTYSSHFHAPRPGQQFHIIIVDNGRSNQLGRSDFKNSLKCIRCAACFNTCPVYRKSGGHSYHSAVGGPIGSILNPNLDMFSNADLPYASTLCGSCSNVCPVKINIHEQLWKWRQILAAEGYADGKKKGMKVLAFILSRPAVYLFFTKIFKNLLKYFPVIFKIKALNPWYKQREMPSPPAKSFRQWYKENNK